MGDLRAEQPSDAHSPDALGHVSGIATGKRGGRGSLFHTRVLPREDEMRSIIRWNCELGENEIRSRIVELRTECEVLFGSIILTLKPALVIQSGSIGGRILHHRAAFLPTSQGWVLTLQIIRTMKNTTVPDETLCLPLPLTGRALHEERSHSLSSSASSTFHRLRSHVIWLPQGLRLS